MNKLRYDIYYIAGLTFISCSVLIDSVIASSLFAINGIFLVISASIIHFSSKE